MDNATGSAAGSAPGAPVADTSAPDAPLFEVKQWNAVALWSWDVSNDVCAICRAPLMSQCIECKMAPARAQAAPGKCTVAWGTCNHAFHYHCISKWLIKRQTCPMDNLPWREYQKIGE